MKPLQEEDYSEIEERFITCYEKHKNSPLRILIGLYKGKYHLFLLSALFFLVKHSPALLLPVATANVINAAFGKSAGAMHSILLNIGLMLGLLAMHIPANYLHASFKSRVIRQAEIGLRGALVRKLQQLSIAYHTEIQSGRLQSKIMRDVEGIETLSQQLFINILNIILNLTVALTITLTKSRTVFFFFLLSAPAAVLAVVSFKQKIRLRNSEFRREMEETSAKVMEMVELIPVTRAHALEKTEISKMQDQLALVAEKGYRLDLVQANFGAVSWIVFQAFQLICLGFTGYMALTGRIQVGDITLYQSYFTTVVNQVSGLINLMPIISKGLESVTSVGEVLLSHNVEDAKGREKVKEVKGAYEFQSVSFAYEADKRVLKDLSIQVEQGQTVAFVGESGSGKSTILNLVIGFIKPTGGRILLDGKDLNGINLRSYRRHLAVVPQTSILFSGSIRDNITYGMKHVKDKDLERIVEAANLKGLIDSLPDGLDTVVGEHGGKLSGGQRQRISIARALIRDPKVIVLDEATSALDTISELEIQKALENLTKGRTTFIVAHRLSTIRNADRIAVVRNGTIAEYGTYGELMDLRGEFYQMQKLQV